jgi:hypothetical protein
MSQATIPKWHLRQQREIEEKALAEAHHLNLCVPCMVLTKGIGHTNVERYFE